MNIARRIIEVFRRVTGVSRLIELQTQRTQQQTRHIELLNLQYIQATCTPVYQTDRARDEKRLLRYGYKIYSQSDEDGIIREIFRRVGTKNKVFFECGVGDGIENNTLALLIDGWTGVRVDGDERNKSAIEKKFAKPISEGMLKYICQFITAERWCRKVGGESESWRKLLVVKP